MVYIIRANKDPICATARPWFNTAYSRANTLASSGAIQPYQHLFGYINPIPFALGYGIYNNNCGCSSSGFPWFNQTISNSWNNMNNCQCSSAVPQFLFNCSTPKNFGNSTLFEIKWDESGSNINCNCDSSTNKKLDTIS